jgi:hypothetical protein
VERLSIPRLFSAGREKFELIRKKSQSQKSLVSSKNTSQTEIVQEEHYPDYQASAETGENEPSTITGEGTEERNVDISVYGMSLKKFFVPRNEALEKLKNQQKSMQKIRWSYPVPNPTVWK